MFLLETLGENCSLAFPSHLHSLACGCITPTSASIIVSSLMLTFPSPFDEDPCDYIGPTHMIQDHLPTSGSLTADAHVLPQHLLPSQCYLCACVRVSILVGTQTLILLCDIGQIPLPFWISVFSTMNWGAEGGNEQGSQAGGRETVCGKDSGLLWFDNIQA